MKERKIKVGVSVIICCYNSEARLKPTLQHLSEQKFNSQIPWEIIVVNNLSTDNTRSVLEDEQHRFNDKRINYKIVEQPIAGLSYAREKGIEVAEYGYLLFCDDDNWLSPNYVSTVYEIMNADETIGVLGGFASFEPELPANPSILPFGDCYCNGPQEERARNDHWVYGAGSTYRKSMLLYLKEIQWKQITTGRKGKKLISCDDLELCYIAYLIGFKIVANNALTFKHFVPKQRQNTAYLFSLFFWIGYSHFLLQGYEKLTTQKNDSLTVLIMKTFKRNLIASLKDYFSLIKCSFLNKDASEKNRLKIKIKQQLGMLYSIVQNTGKTRSQFNHIKKLLDTHAQSNNV